MNTIAHRSVWSSGFVSVEKLLSMDVDTRNRKRVQTYLLFEYTNVAIRHFTFPHFHSDKRKTLPTSDNTQHVKTIQASSAERLRYRDKNIAFDFIGFSLSLRKFDYISFHGEHITMLSVAGSQQRKC